ncbi:EAL domain-containing protein [Falsibacillus albus]|uniref:EAL domain-containing protein n=1 Tax=Falsibacillus albus TaxID=2478915 RepID=A0A3L7K3B2_9BACI|nr:EAL domain-containing protein [Falsibacillus albus]RLQ97125.1 EAL domain-containing protein [Falsibacillus albus]
MKTTCFHCGIPFTFLSQGFFLLKKAENDGRQMKELSNLGFLQQSMNTYYYHFEQFQELIAIMEACNKINMFEGVQVGISRTKETNKWFTFETFLLYLRNKEMIEFIQYGGMVSHLQPIVDMQNLGIYGYESLLRSEDEGANINPSQLFQLADRTGLHSLLDKRARETAIKTRHGSIPDGIKSFINFLPSTIYNPEYCLRHTFQIVEQYKVQPEDLVFEVVETEKIEDVHHLQSVLDRYKREGMKVALDDVGTGFATIDMLSRLQPDYVKIDREYISFCDRDGRKQNFLNEVIELAEKLGFIILAEGIERMEEWYYCRDAGIHLGQGYLIGKPSLHPKMTGTFWCEVQ